LGLLRAHCSSRLKELSKLGIFQEILLRENSSWDALGYVRVAPTMNGTTRNTCTLVLTAFHVSLYVPCNLAADSSSQLMSVVGGEPVVVVLNLLEGGHNFGQ